MAIVLQVGRMQGHPTSLQVRRRRAHEAMDLADASCHERVVRHLTRAKHAVHVLAKNDESVGASGVDHRGRVTRENVHRTGVAKERMRLHEPGGDIPVVEGVAQLVKNAARRCRGRTQRRRPELECRASSPACQAKLTTLRATIHRASIEIGCAWWTRRCPASSSAPHSPPCAHSRTESLRTAPTAPVCSKPGLGPGSAPHSGRRHRAGSPLPRWNFSGRNRVRSHVVRALTGVFVHAPSRKWATSDRLSRSTRPGLAPMLTSGSP